MAKTPRRMKYNCESAFAGIELRDKSILEIGAGKGILSAYMASFARHVVAMEPEAAGSSEGVLAMIAKLRDRLAIENLQVVTTKLQEYDAGNQSFDVVVLHDSINHLDEKACQELRCSDDARRTYRDIFTQIVQMTVQGGRVVIFDCSPRNFFAWSGIKHPVTPQIEWEKHQPPEVWCSLLKPLGVVRESLSWTVAYPLHAFAPLLSNSIAAFFLFSHFRLVLRLDS